MLPQHSLARVLVPVVLGALLLCSGVVVAMRLLVPRQPHSATTPSPVVVAEPPPAPSNQPQPSVPSPPAPRGPERPAERPPVVPPPPSAPDVRPRVGADRPLVPVLTDVPTVSPRSSLPAELQQRVNQAIDRGVKYLLGHQRPSGTWEDHHPVALAALPGLTLLECGVPASDERIQKAAKYVRANVARVPPMAETYTLSLVVLFLDRLRDPADRDLLRSLSLRIIAGQESDGGWGYALPKLTPDVEKKLERVLALTRPRDLTRLTRSFEEQRGLPRLTMSPDGPASPSPGPGGSLRPLDAPPSEAEINSARGDLPEALRKLPSTSDHPVAPKSATKTLGPRGKGKGGKVVKIGPGGTRTDNSNTQFATLALWAALRNGVPAERALEAVAERFRLTQTADGRWNYHASVFSGHGSPAMTGVGLLGLAIGHGLTPDRERKAALEDEGVKRGLKALSHWVAPDGPKNLYFLWTLERVGVLYDVREIGGKDWYRHAVDLLLPMQQEDGHWSVGGYPGWSKRIDTSLALLILKRANFTPELTRQLDTRLIKAR